MGATGKPVGIDVGTWKVSAAFLDSAGHSQIIRDLSGEAAIFNTVRFTDAEIMVGKRVQDVMFTHREEVAYWIKRELGTRLYSRPIRGQKLPPEVIQACVLRELRDIIFRQTNSDPLCVIAFPTYFDELRRKALVDAAEIAGLTVVGLVDEGIAAVMAHCEATGLLLPQDQPGQRCFLVFDLGGGACQLTLVSVERGIYRILAYDADLQLSGYDFDLELGELIAERMIAAGRPDPRSEPALWNRVYAAVVEAKHSLSARPRTRVDIDFGPWSFETIIHREDFENQCAPILERLRRLIGRMVKRMSAAGYHVDAVVPIGGAVHMPMIQNLLVETLGASVSFSGNPEEAVARGAALFAGSKIGFRPTPTPKQVHPIWDAASEHRGLDVVGFIPHALLLQLPTQGRVEEYTLISEGAQLPIDARCEIPLPTGESQPVVFHVCEETLGERRVLGELQVSGTLPQLGKAIVEIQVICKKTGSFDWSARLIEPATELTVRFTPLSGLEKDIVTHWRKTLADARTWPEVSHGLTEEPAASGIPPGPPTLRAGLGERTGTPAQDKGEGRKAEDKPRHPRLAAAQARGRWEPLQIPPTAFAAQGESSEARLSPEVAAPPDASPAPGLLPQKPSPERPHPQVSPLLTGPLIGKDRPRITREQLLADAWPVQSTSSPIAYFPSPSAPRSFSPQSGEADLGGQGGISPVAPASVTPASTARRQSQSPRVHIAFGITVPRSLVAVVGFLISAALGLAIGYWLVSQLFPQSWVMRLW